MNVETKDLLKYLIEVAPEIEDEDPIGEDENFREVYDLDSVDFLNFLVKLNEVYKVEIPESDYGKLTSLVAIKSYLTQK